MRTEWTLKSCGSISSDNSITFESSNLWASVFRSAPSGLFVSLSVSPPPSLRPHLVTGSTIFLLVECPLRALKCKKRVSVGVHLLCEVTGLSNLEAAELRQSSEKIERKESVRQSPQVNPPVFYSNVIAIFADLTLRLFCYAVTLY